MAQPTTPAQLAEAAHPAIVDRLVEQLQDVTLLLATTEAVTFVDGGEPRAALDALAATADDLAQRASRLNPTIHTRP